MARTKAISLIQTGSTKVELSELSGLVISNIQKETLAAGLKSQSYTGNPATGSVEYKRFKNSASQAYGTARTAGKGAAITVPPTTVNLDIHREIVEEAYAGDIIGVFDPGIFSIGDTICEPKMHVRFEGIPTFAPEHFSIISQVDTMKRKQFVKGTEQIAQEGAIQIFKTPYTGMEEVIVGVVGTLQFDVFQYRMRSEYGVELYMEGLPYEHLRVITACPCKPEDLVLCTGAAVLQDFRDRYLLAFDGEWSVGFLTKHNPGLVLADTLSV